MTWLLLAGYLVGAVVVGRRVAWMVAESHSEFDPNPLGGMLAGYVGLLTALVWPLAVCMGLMVWRRRPTSGELKRERDALRERVDRLEAELGVGEEWRPSSPCPACGGTAGVFEPAGQCIACNGTGR